MASLKLGKTNGMPEKPASAKAARHRGKAAPEPHDDADTDGNLDTAAAENIAPRISWKRKIGRLFLWAAGGYAAVLTAHLIIFAFAPPVSSMMLGRWFSGQPVSRTYVSLDNVAPRMIASVIASEDSQFCRHWGVDFGAVWDVLENSWNDDEAPTRGASTITMQVVKNLYFWQLPGYVRKLFEYPTALFVDLIWSKERIMEVYLNIAEWGPDGVIGVEAGAQRAFGRSAKVLTARQASILTTSLPNPIKRNAAKPSRRQLLVAGVVERRARSADLPLECFSENHR